MAKLSRPIIDGLFNVLTASKFIADFWPNRAVHTHGNVTRLPSVFSSELLGDFTALAQRYRGPAFYFDAENGVMRPVDRPPLQLYRSGRTIYFGDVEPFIDGVTVFLREFEQELGVNPGCARMGVFASPQNDGATIHYDTNEVFSIQLIGSKQFHIAPLKELSYPAGLQYSTSTAPEKLHYPQMQNGFPDPANAQFECVNMEVGSVLFMPRGTWHHTSADSSESLAVSIIVDPPLAVDMILDHLKITLMQNQEWRKPVMGCWDSSDLPDQTKKTLGTLIQQLQSVTQNLQQESIVQGAGNHQLWFDKINQETRFQVIPTATMVFQEVGDHTQVTIKVSDISRGERQTGSVKVDAGIRKLLEWMLDRKQPFTAVQLAAAFNENPGEIIGLLQGLAASEVLMPLCYDQIT